MLLLHCSGALNVVSSVAQVWLPSNAAFLLRLEQGWSLRVQRQSEMLTRPDFSVQPALVNTCARAPASSCSSLPTRRTLGFVLVVQFDEPVRLRGDTVTFWHSNASTDGDPPCSWLRAEELHTYGTFPGLFRLKGAYGPYEADVASITPLRKVPCGCANRDTKRTDARSCAVFADGRDLCMALTLSVSHAAKVCRFSAHSMGKGMSKRARRVTVKSASFWRCLRRHERPQQCA